MPEPATIQEQEWQRKLAQEQRKAFLLQARQAATGAAKEVVKKQVKRTVLRWVIVTVVGFLAATWYIWLALLIIFIIIAAVAGTMEKITP